MESKKEKFPQIAELIPPKLRVPGVEFMYAKAEGIVEFHKEGWRQMSSCAPFDVEGVPYVVMRRGEPIGSSDLVIPKVTVNEMVMEESA